MQMAFLFCSGILQTRNSFFSMIGSDPATTNYPGKIPRGLDRPSDAPEEDGPKTNRII